MKKSTIFITISVIALLILVIYPMFKTGDVITGNVVRADTFEGTITNLELEPGTYRGVGVYDRNCIPVNPANPHGKVNCDAGIETKFGVLNFHYEHIMSVQPCIMPGQQVTLEVLGGGKAIVRI